MQKRVKVEVQDDPEKRPLATNIRRVYHVVNMKELRDVRTSVTLHKVWCKQKVIYVLRFHIISRVR